MKVPVARSIRPGAVIIISLGIILLALSGFLTPLTRLILAPFLQAQTWIAERYNAIASFVNAPADVAALRQRNAQLEAENARLELQVIQLQQQVREAEVLSSLVDYARSSVQSRYAAAAVIGYDTNPFMRYILINRGADDGLKIGMPIVTNQGLVGQIAAITSGAARVRLITDPSSVVDVHLQNADVDAILQGQITGEASLEMIPQTANVQPGDLILTSGLGGNYPANIVVGQVATVRKRDFDLFQSASVQLAVDFARLEIVLVISNFQPVDIAPLIPTPAP